MPKPAITTFSSLTVKESPTNKNNGFYAPQLTTVQRDAIPAATLVNGAIIYNIDENTLQHYQNNTWVNINVGPGDVVGPDGAINNNIAVFNGTTGKIIRDSGVIVTRVPLAAQRQLANFVPNVDVNEIGELGHIKFVNDVGIIFVDSLMPVEFITNNFGSDEQVCSLFTGGLPSSSTTPSALVELQTTTGALLLSRLTQIEIDDLFAAPGMLVFNTDTQELNIYDGTVWTSFYSPGRPTTISEDDTLENLAIGNFALNPTTGSSNLAIGFNALSNNTTGGSNLAIGPTALLTNTTGSSNLAIGPTALSNNTTGGSNLAIGASALFSNTTASNNVAIGPSALFSNTTGSSNLAIGASALQKNTTASNNVAIGLSALFSNTTGGSNLAIGPTALLTNNTGGSNLAIGASALFSNTTASNNVAIGPSALFFNTTGTNNLAIGANTLGRNTTASNNVAIGLSALFSNTTGGSNLAIGASALQSNTTASNNLAIGLSALQSNTTASNNLAIGLSALQSNTTGSNNLAIGPTALLTNNTGGSNLAIGFNALFSNTTASSNVAIGPSALFFNTTGSSNLAIGASALQSNTTGFNNLAIGPTALLNNTTASNNVAIGILAMRFSTTGIDNVAIGSSALLNNTTGSQNVVIGSYTGQARINLSGCILIGSNSNTIVDSLTNAIAIGDSATVAASNTCTIGKLASPMKLGIGVDPTGDIQTSNTVANNKIVLNETAANQHQFKGFGTEASTLRYQVAASTDSHKFYSGINSVSSLELFTITGTGDTVTTGNIYGQRPRALMTASDGVLTSFPVAGTWTKALTTTATGFLNLFDMPVNNRLRYIGTRTIYVQVNLSMTLIPTAGTTTLSVALFKNNVLITNPDQNVTCDALRYSSFSTNSIIQMQTNDYIEVFLRSSTINSTQSYYNISITTV
jgi:NDP-sugar pyrophosphorylase family protein